MQNTHRRRSQSWNKHDSSSSRAYFAGDHEGQGGSLVLEANQWRRGRRHPPLNFGLSENLLLLRNFSSKNANFKAEKLILGKFRVKIEILSIHGLLRRTFAAVCVITLTNKLPSNNYL